MKRTKEPPVPFVPASLAELQARYPKALEFVYDQQAIVQDNAIRPGEVAANLFDFEDGLRLLVSRERTPSGQVVLHVSASFQDDCKIADNFRRWLGPKPSKQKRQRLANNWAITIPARFIELSGDTLPLKFIGWTSNYVPHWMRIEVSG